MIQKLFIVVEWGVGTIASAAVASTLLFVMFTDSPSFGSNFSALQRAAFQYQGLFVVLLPGIFLVSFVAQFFVKSIPWHHIAGATGLAGIFYASVFFSAYRK